jgi:carbon-monoxide dehydrogenase large subunit
MKGVGEAGAIGSPAAVAAAVEDALRPFGATITRLPVTPETVRALIAAGAGTESSALGQGATR